MKKICTAFISFFMSLLAYAQGTQSATLQHGQEYKIFYSADALKDALQNADHGDVITLSPGMFNAVNINKAITLRGAGTESLDSLMTKNYVTVLNGNYVISIPDSIVGHSLYMEGITHPQSTVSINYLKDATFAKCQFYHIAYYDYSNSQWQNLSFIHAYIKNLFSSPSNTSVSFYNSVIINFKSNSSEKSQYSFYNSVIANSMSSNIIYRSYFENCILHNTGTSKTSKLNGDTNVSFHSIFSGPHADEAFPGVNSNHGNINYDPSLSPFEDATFYRLTELAKSYKGNDDTEIGIYGGMHPFSITTTYPQIKKLIVAPESDSDGKLQIDIEISTNSIQ